MELKDLKWAASLDCHDRLHASLFRRFDLSEACRWHQPFRCLLRAFKTQSTFLFLPTGSAAILRHLLTNITVGIKPNSIVTQFVWRSSSFIETVSDDGKILQMWEVPNFIGDRPVHLIEVHLKEYQGRQKTYSRRNCPRDYVAVHIDKPK